jgi:NhaP-type Na+/H+ or K+/H+ antiporter
MTYRPKSPWYFVVLAIIGFAEAARAKLNDPRLQRSYVAWMLFGSVIALIVAAHAWYRSRPRKHPERTT